MSEVSQEARESRYAELKERLRARAGEGDCPFVTNCFCDDEGSHDVPCNPDGHEAAEAIEALEAALSPSEVVIHERVEINEAWALRQLAARERMLGFTTYAEWLEGGCVGKGEWEYPREQIDDAIFYANAALASLPASRSGWDEDEEALVERVRKELFGNLAHYRQGCSYEADDAREVLKFSRSLRSLR